MTLTLAVSRQERQHEMLTALQKQDLNTTIEASASWSSPLFSLSVVVREVSVSLPTLPLS